MFLLNCDFCQKNRGIKERRRMRCGWLPSNSWPNREPRGGDSYMANAPKQLSPVCPGYAIRLPIVHEAYTALTWREKGSLRDLYDVPVTDLVRDAINIAATSRAELESHLLKEAQRKKA